MLLFPAYHRVMPHMQFGLRTNCYLIAVIAGFALVMSGRLLADWPMLRGTPHHDGYAEFEVHSAYHRAWAVEFDNERLGSATEPVVASGLVYVATHGGNIYALDADTGDPQWRFATGNPFLHSPAVGGGIVIAADSAGRLFGLDSDSGELRWLASVSPGGAAAAPVVAKDTVFIGSRAGVMLAVNLRDGRELWRCDLGAPIRQTAAVADDRVFVTAEDLHVFALKTENGGLLWKSQALAGQSARDYYPVIVHRGDRAFVIVRTNPAHKFSDRINWDRHFLAVHAGADDSHWQKLDAWLKSHAARGTPELWAREQAAVAGCLATNRLAQTFFVLDAATGRELDPAPVFWAAGCQGVGAPPARTADGRLLVFYRSAYGNWNHGVAPMVALGLLDVVSNRAIPLFHTHGAQPPWNTFWGTADESQHFLVAGNAVLIVHQGTLSAFDLNRSNLFSIHGERDTYGGLRNPHWARNEWHGPGRGGVALDGDRIYWQTGSRVLCLAPDRGESATVRTVRAKDVRTMRAPEAMVDSVQTLREELERQVVELLSARWAPLLVEPGLAGRGFYFADTSVLFECLSWAFPHLTSNQQSAVRARLAAEFGRHPPFSRAAGLPLNEGKRREWSSPPDESLTRIGSDRPLHPFAGAYAAWVYGQRCCEQERVKARWPEIRESFRQFVATGWRLDGTKGDLYANRYLRALLALEEMAKQAGDEETFAAAKLHLARNLAQLALWWQRAAAEGTLGTFKTTAELDPFIGRGDGLSFRIAPHHHKVALLDGLSPELAARVREEAGAFIAPVWFAFERQHATWWIVGEERQVHFGENYVDPPDLAVGAFTARAWLMKAPTDELAGRVDLPFCRADLFRVQKLAVALDLAAGQ